MPRPGLRIAQREPVRLDLAPAQAAYLARPASGQENEPHRCDPERAFAFEPPQGCAELGEIVRTEQPPARRTAVAGDAGARVSRCFGPMAPRDGAVEHVTQYLMTAIRAARLASSVFVEEAGDIACTMEPTRRYPQKAP